MFENLIQFIENRLKMAQTAVLYSTKNAYYHQAFGAVDFAGSIVTTAEEYDILAHKWTNEWKPAFLDLMLEVNDYEETT